MIVSETTDRVLLSLIAVTEFLFGSCLLVLGLFGLGYGAAAAGAARPFDLLVFIGLAGLIGSWFVERGRISGRVFGALWYCVIAVTIFTEDRNGWWKLIVPWSSAMAIYLIATAVAVRKGRNERCA